MCENIEKHMIISRKTQKTFEEKHEKFVFQSNESLYQEKANVQQYFKERKPTELQLEKKQQDKEKET